MPTKLPDSLVEGILGMIASSPAGCRLSWKDVLAFAERLNGSPVTRQWLWKKAEIKTALRRHNEGDVAPALTRMQAAERTIAGLREEIARRDRLLSEYDERFAKHMYWLRLKNLKQADLEAAIRSLRD